MIGFGFLQAGDKTWIFGGGIILVAVFVIMFICNLISWLHNDK